MPPTAQGLPDGAPGRVFATTRWTVVLQAGGATSADSAAALEQLCRAYWYPIYYFARRSGLAPHDAEDATQSFFGFLLEKDVIARADRSRGRFRSFLLASFRNFLANERAHRATVRRGGGQPVISLDELRAEQRYQLEPVSPLSPERLYDHKWAASLLDRVLTNLRAEYDAVAKGALFDVLRRVVIGGPSDAGYAELAREAGLTENAFKVAVHRLRHRFREALRAEVAHTVETPAAVDEELRHLIASLAG